MSAKNRNVAINCQFAEFLGMQKCDKLPGAYWDATALIKRTRMVRDSELHEIRKARGIKGGSTDFIFDVFSNHEDMRRVEAALGINGHNLKERAEAALRKLEEKR